MASPLISLRDATVAHGDGLPPVLHEISLDVHRGDWIAVAGDNGSGKTTLLATLGGVLPLRSGHIERGRGLRAALLLQEPDNQLVASSVERELALSVPRDVSRDEQQKRITETIDRFELGRLLDRNPHRLSGGEKQRLALATVWLEKPGVLLLDEPLSFLDDEMSARVVSFVRELNADGIAIVWATPGGEYASLAKDVIALADGRRVSWIAPPTMPQLPPSKANASAIVVERVRFESVSFAYPDTPPLLTNIDLWANGGVCLGIQGRNGSGKSTVLLLAGGALPPASGRVVRNTREHGVVYLPQSPERLFFAETVLEEVSFGLVRRGVTRETAHERARAALSRASLDPAQFASRSPFELSFGEMRRVAFAIAFALEPDLLLLDEPASCLDQDGRAVLARLIDESRASGAAVIIASHESLRTLPCDRVIDLGGGGPGTIPRRDERMVDAGHAPG